jgi:hypothetical protein
MSVVGALRSNHTGVNERLTLLTGQRERYSSRSEEVVIGPFST